MVSNRFEYRITQPFGHTKSEACLVGHGQRIVTKWDSQPRQCMRSGKIPSALLRAPPPSPHPLSPPECGGGSDNECVEDVDGGGKDEEHGDAATAFVIAAGVARVDDPTPGHQL